MSELFSLFAFFGSWNTPAWVLRASICFSERVLKLKCVISLWSEDLDAFICVLTGHLLSLHTRSMQRELATGFGGSVGKALHWFSDWPLDWICNVLMDSKICIPLMSPKSPVWPLPTSLDLILELTIQFSGWGRKDRSSTGSIAYAWRGQVLTHTCPSSCGRNHGQRKTSVVSKLCHLWGGVTWNKSDWPSYTLQCIQIKFFAPVVCWKFSGNLALHKDSLLWVILSHCVPGTPGPWPRGAGVNIWIIAGSVVGAEVRAFVTSCNSFQVPVDPTDPSKAFCLRMDATFLLLEENKNNTGIILWNISKVWISMQRSYQQRGQESLGISVSKVWAYNCNFKISQKWWFIRKSEILEEGRYALSSEKQQQLDKCRLLLLLTFWENICNRGSYSCERCQKFFGLPVLLSQSITRFSA